MCDAYLSEGAPLSSFVSSGRSKDEFNGALLLFIILRMAKIDECEAVFGTTAVACEGRET